MHLNEKALYGNTLIIISLKSEKKQNKTMQNKTKNKTVQNKNKTKQNKTKKQNKTNKNKQTNKNVEQSFYTGRNKSSPLHTNPHGGRECKHCSL